MKIDWKTKLASRKFWALLAALAVALLALFGVGEPTVGHVAALLGACGVFAAYIYGESKVDAARVSAEVVAEISEKDIMQMAAAGIEKPPDEGTA